MRFGVDTSSVLERLVYPALSKLILPNHRNPSLILCPAGSLWELAEALAWNGYANCWPGETMSLQRFATSRKPPNCGHLQALQTEDHASFMNVM